MRRNDWIQRALLGDLVMGGVMDDRKQLLRVLEAYLDVRDAYREARADHDRKVLRNLLDERGEALMHAHHGFVVGVITSVMHRMAETIRMQTTDRMLR